jgi:hypothetical protein
MENQTDIEATRARLGEQSPQDSAGDVIRAAPSLTGK